MSVSEHRDDPGAPGSDEAVLYQVRDSGVAVLTFNRPERMNAWGQGLSTGFYACIERAEADPAVRVIVVTGKGRAFCAGADMGNLDSISATTVESAGKTDISALVAAKHPYFLTQLSKPVIVAINGSVAGMGLSQALFADIRFAAAGAKFSTSFARRGLIAEYGISWILPRLIGWARAVELLLSGRTFLAEEAAELGLLTRVLPAEELMPTVLGYADEMARNCSPTSLAVMKQQLYADAAIGMVETSVKAEALMHDSMRRTDFIEGITAFFQKRPPNFPPLADHLTA
ncbi:enoyl-CoA hydratase [Mycolicibacterium fallax]|uniref:Enoyl-CoA hydratase n=1 Tax=Mycolicibacterium fallax TaxID=1793 RepID=A0A1X1R3M4_MYCFA|nr:enoyl-CoA hydratase [Mycolicibacterium fallax]ORU98923.1 enoyl-CoA hydratase [Mycolicibacterium fallax]BBZ00008.1 enoyl-CoA hydratase [Mycolicibacterium fallax]